MNQIEGDYRILSILGIGGYGVVYKVENMRNNKTLAFNYPNLFSK